MFNAPRRLSAVVASLAIFGTALIGGTFPASAGEAGLNVDPSSLHAGEVITASSTCSGANIGLALYAGSFPDVTPNGTPIATSTIKLDDSDWSGELTVPTGTAPGAYTLAAHCYGNDDNYYTNAVVTVLPDATTTTTSTVASTMASTTTAVLAKTAPATAVPAKAVPATPTYTG